jgi:hypothetical protein
MLGRAISGKAWMLWAQSSSASVDPCSLPAATPDTTLHARFPSNHTEFGAVLSNAIFQKNCDCSLRNCTFVQEFLYILDGLCAR